MVDISKVKKNPTMLAAACSAVALIVGLSIGKFALGTNLGNMTATNSTAVSPQQSGEIVANYTYGGKTYNITLDDMFSYNDSAANANDDGSYAMPTTEEIISYARKQIIADTAAKKNISVSEQDKLDYIKNQFGAETMDDLAVSMGRTTEQTDQLVTETLIQTKLYEEVAGTMPDLPAFPDYPENEDEEAKVEAYATYITEIAGEEFADGKWADEDGEFAKALPDFDGKTASYRDATAAYQVLYNRANTQMNELNQKWLDFENETLKDCAITIGTLIQ